MTNKIVIDMRHLSGYTLAAAGEILGCSIVDAANGPKGVLIPYAVGFVQHPELNIDFEEFTKTPLEDLDVINEDADPKAHGANNGAEPQPSLASGT